MESCRVWTIWVVLFFCAMYFNVEDLMLLLFF